MRKVETEIVNLGLENGSVVHLSLLDIIGRPLSFVEDGKLIKYDDDITIDSDTLSFELWENENSNSISYYQLTINEINYKFTVPKGSGTHELMSLFTLSCNDEISYILRGQTYFNEDFIKKIKTYLNGEEPYFSKNQQNVFDQFVYFGNEIHGTDRTIDSAEALNKYLGSI